MNNKEKYIEDPLKFFLKKDNSENAPEGFTSKIMSRIQVETVPEKAKVLFSRRNIIPHVSAAVILVLILIAILLPESKSDLPVSAFADFFKSLKISLPDINLNSVFGFSLPAPVFYILIAIFILMVFDRALYGVFNKQK